MYKPNDKILLIDSNRQALKLIHDKLSEFGFQVIATGGAEEALAFSLSTVPDLIVSNVTLPKIDGYEFCRRLKLDPRTRAIPVILLTERNDVDDMVRGFEAGADDYLVKTSDPTELGFRIRALLTRIRAAPGRATRISPQGRVISVFSPRGGVGKSTLAANLVASLRKLWTTRVVIVDLALEVDQAALMFNLKTKLTWAGLADIGPDDLDEDVVMRHLTRHESGVHLLAAPSSPELASLVTPELVGRVLTLLCSQQEYVVVDLPPSFAGTNLAALDVSDLIVLVLTPELASLKATRTALDVFESLGYSGERLVAVLNQTFPKKGISSDSIEDFLALPLTMTVPYERSAFVEAINRGVPYVLSHSTAKTSMEIQKFAYQISAADMEGTNDLPASTTLERVKAALDRQDRRSWRP